MDWSRSIAACSLGALCLALPVGVARAQTADPDQTIALHLADLLRAGRSVVSSHQAVINNPDLGDKGFTGDALVSQADAAFAEQNGGAAPAAVAVSDQDRRLMAALTEAMHAVVDAQQADINQPGVGFKGFIPAVFSRLTNEQFEALAGSEARMRVTAPPDLVRNRKARPDAWERQVIETQFLGGDWPKGQAWSEQVTVDGRPAFRMMLPEYYRDSCLECHGTPKGAVDITGYPKEGGALGDLGGVISITIFR